MGDISWHKETKASKDRQCESCLSAIPKGSVYSRHWGIFDGEWYKEILCLACREAASEAWRCGHDEIGLGIELYEWYEEEERWGDMPSKMNDHWQKMKERRAEASNKKDR